MIFSCCKKKFDPQIIVPEQVRMIVHLINKQRRENNLPLLKYSRWLITTAQIRAQELPEIWDNQPPKDHRGFDRHNQRLRKIGFKWCKENLGWGYTSQEKLFLAWNNSIPHRKNMMNEQWRYVGFAKTIGRKNNYSVIVFGK